jgi:hypothetical protein
VRGYSSSARKEDELAAARGNPDVDWIVVRMHQVAISTADLANGADLGIREEWVPFFYKHGVDLESSTITNARPIAAGKRVPSARR